MTACCIAARRSPRGRATPGIRGMIVRWFGGSTPLRAFSSGRWSPPASNVCDSGRDGNPFCKYFSFLVSQPEESGLKPFCSPRAAEIDYLRQRECSPARLAIGQRDRLGFGVDIEPFAGRLRPVASM